MRTLSAGVLKPSSSQGLKLKRVERTRANARKILERREASSLTRIWLILRGLFITPVSPDLKTNQSYSDIPFAFDCD